MPGLEDIVYDTHELSNDLILQALNEVGERGDIMLLKHDGPRSDAKYTVVIISGNSAFDSIRKDGDELGAIVIFCLRRYFDQLKVRGK